MVIYRHKDKYPISEMCRFFGVSRSGYYGYVSQMDIPAKDLPLAEKIKECQKECGKTYGYLRVWLCLERKGIYRNPKTVLRVMQKYGLLSVIRDLYDNSIVSYKMGTDGTPVIVPEEAQIVRLIYKLFIEGKTVNAIARQLTKANIPTPRGKDTWQTSTIESILTNEKYKGAAILQKKFLQKKMKANEGEVPQYYVTESHPAIIPPEEWEIVQSEMKHENQRVSTIIA